MSAREIDAELIAMCDCPEIQDRWEPKVGDRVHDKDPDCNYWYVIRIPDVACMDQPRIEIVAQSGRGTDNIHTNKALHIPRIEDALEWLVPKYCSHWDVALHELSTSPRYSGFNVPIKAALAMLMYIEHNKTWDGKAWA